MVIEPTTLILKNDVSELERVLSCVSDLCGRNSVSPEIENDINLALDEIITNVARHAFPEGEEHQFSLQLSVNAEEFVARVEDEGVAFNPIEHPAPNLAVPLEERKEGGLGIFLVRQTMTSVKYQRLAGKNVVTLRKRLA